MFIVTCCPQLRSCRLQTAPQQRQKSPPGAPRMLGDESGDLERVTGCERWMPPSLSGAKHVYLFVRQRRICPLPNSAFFAFFLIRYNGSISVFQVGILDAKLIQQLWDILFLPTSFFSLFFLYPQYLPSLLLSNPHCMLFYTSISISLSLFALTISHALCMYTLKNSYHFQKLLFLNWIQAWQRKQGWRMLLI